MEKEVTRESANPISPRPPSQPSIQGSPATATAFRCFETERHACTKGALRKFVDGRGTGVAARAASGRGQAGKGTGGSGMRPVRR